MVFYLLFALIQWVSSHRANPAPKVTSSAEEAAATLRKMAEAGEDASAVPGEPKVATGVDDAAAPGAGASPTVAGDPSNPEV
jgi:hypothetical protein